MMPDSPKPACPGWMRGEVAKMLNQLDGTHDEVLVAAVAALGPEGFDVQHCEQSTNFDPNAYGPAMLEGFTMLAGTALAQVLGTVYAATQSEHHFTQDIEDPAERIQAMRNLYEQAIRDFLTSVFTYAGAQYQQAPGRQGNLSMAAGSQMVGLWHKVAEATITFHGPKEPQTPEHPDEPKPPGH